MRCAPLMAVISGTLLFAGATVAQAVDINRFKIRHAVDICQGSLPSFEGALRKRPLAIANEGTSTSFVGCSLEAADEFNRQRTEIGAIFINRGTSPATVNCTLVNGLLNRISPSYYPKSALIAPGDEAVLAWTTADQAGGFSFPNLNCSLPPGVEIGWIRDRYPEDVGA